MLVHSPIFTLVNDGMSVCAQDVLNAQVHIQMFTLGHRSAPDGARSVLVDYFDEIVRHADHEPTLNLGDAEIHQLQALLLGHVWFPMCIQQATAKYGFGLTASALVLAKNWQKICGLMHSYIKDSPVHEESSVPVRPLVKLLHGRQIVDEVSDSE